MSRIGRAPIELPNGVTLDVTTEGDIIVTGPKGTLRQQIASSDIKVEKNTTEAGKTVVTVTRANDEKENRAKHGLYRALLANMVKGVTEGYSKSLTVHGVGFKIAVAGNKLTLNIGLSHPVNVEIPEGLTVVCPSQTEIKISGIDKQLVGEFAANVRKIRKPEPYKGKGIRYSDEIIRRKEGKKAK